MVINNLYRCIETLIDCGNFFLHQEICHTTKWHKMCGLSRRKQDGKKLRWDKEERGEGVELRAGKCVREDHPAITHPERSSPLQEKSGSIMSTWTARGQLGKREGGSSYTCSPVASSEPASVPHQGRSCFKRPRSFQNHLGWVPVGLAPVISRGPQTMELCLKRPKGAGTHWGIGSPCFFCYVTATILFLR